MATKKIKKKESVASWMKVFSVGMCVTAELPDAVTVAHRKLSCERDGERKCSEMAQVAIHRMRKVQDSVFLFCCIDVSQRACAAG